MQFFKRGNEFLIIFSFFVLQIHALMFCTFQGSICFITQWIQQFWLRKYKIQNKILQLGKVVTLHSVSMFFGFNCIFCLQNHIFLLQNHWGFSFDSREIWFWTSFSSEEVANKMWFKMWEQILNDRFEFINVQWLHELEISIHCRYSPLLDNVV